MTVSIGVVQCESDSIVLEHMICCSIQNILNIFELMNRSYLPAFPNVFYTECVLWFVLDNPLAVVERPSPNVAHISYQPSLEEQRENSQQGVAGQFLVQYDVDRDSGAGDVQVRKHLIT